MENKKDSLYWHSEDSDEKRTDVEYCAFGKKTDSLPKAPLAFDNRQEQLFQFHCNSLRRELISNDF